MFYPECERCAIEYPDLTKVSTKIDKILNDSSQSGIFRPEIIACKISESLGQVTGVFEILTEYNLVVQKNYLECPNPHCEGLIDTAEYYKAVDDGDSIECPYCETKLNNRRLTEVTVFRFNPTRIKDKKSKGKITKTRILPYDFEGYEHISILFVSADPSDATRLRLGEEFREIQDKLKRAKDRDRLKLQLPGLSTRPEDISQALLDFQPQIVHFSGHGTSDGSLCFENNSGEAHNIEPEALAVLFKQFTPHLICVILNACFSEKQALAISQHVKYVIGMKKEINDKAAIAYSIGFYQALGAGRNIPDSHELGLAQIRLWNIPDYLTPVLCKKSDEI